MKEYEEVSDTVTITHDGLPVDYTHYANNADIKIGDKVLTNKAVYNLEYELHLFFNGEDILKDFWYLHSIQNLVVLCRDCHEGDSGRGVHGGNEKLRQQLRYSFTCPITGFNVPFYRKKNLYTIY